MNNNNLPTFSVNNESTGFRIDITPVTGQNKITISIFDKGNNLISETTESSIDFQRGTTVICNMAKGSIADRFLGRGRFFTEDENGACESLRIAS